MSDAPTDVAWQMPVAPNGSQLIVPGDDDDEQREETATDRVAQMLSAAEGDERAKVQLWKRNPQNKVLGWCEDYSPAEFESGGHQMIRERWGPGDYIAKLYGTIPGKAGKPGYGVIKTAPVTVAAAPGFVGAAIQQAQQSSDLARVLDAMQANQREFQSQLMQSLNNRPDPMANMGQMLALMTSMREAMGMNQAPSSGVGAIKELLLGLQAMREAKDLIEPEKPDTDNPLSMLGPILEMVKTGMSQQQAQAVPMIAAPPTLQRAASVIHHPQPAQQENPQVNPLQAVAALKAAIAPLLAMAAQNAALDDALDYLCSESIPSEFEQIEPLLGEANWFELLCTLVPEAKPHEGWLRTVRDAYMALPDAPEDGDSAPQSPAQG